MANNNTQAILRARLASLPDAEQMIEAISGVARVVYDAYPQDDQGPGKFEASFHQKVERDLTEFLREQRYWLTDNPASRPANPKYGDKVQTFIENYDRILVAAQG